MNKIKIKPVFFSRRINSLALAVILITVLVLKFTEIDKTIYVSIASVVMFLILLFLFYLNSREIQSIALNDNMFTITYFNKKSFFFRKVDTTIQKNNAVINTSGDKITITADDNFIGNIRLKALENRDDAEVLLKYFS